jgi:hypothetical protein
MSRTTDCDEKLDRLLSCLEGVKETGEGRFSALCPAHDDHNPSLSITVTEDKIIPHCFAGCEQSEILGAVGLHWQDLYFDTLSRTKPHSGLNTYYDYHDENGDLIFQVIRSYHKGFMPRRPDPERPGKWIYNLKGVKRLIYRLPEVLEAVQKGLTVCITEGEKDADNLNHLGWVATTNPFGAGNWLDEFSGSFKGVNVAIFTDNDAAGQRHGRQVARSLWGKAASVKIVELPGLPEKGDVSDWLLSGGTVEELHALVDETPYWFPDEKDDVPPLSEDEDDRPIIETNGVDPIVKIIASVQAIQAANDPPTLFRRNGNPVIVSIDENRHVSIREMNVHDMRYFMARSARYLSTSERRGSILVDPPISTAQMILSIPGGPREWPPLEALVTAPVLSRELKLETTPGYLPSARLYYHDALGIEDLPDFTPTRENLDNALKLLKYLFSDFPFADEASFANHLGMVLLPFVRPYIRGTTPFHLYEAPKEGTGKSLLVETSIRIFDPLGAKATSAPTSEEEMRKKITALLQTGRPHIWFDNLRGKIDSSALEGALTSPVYSDRKLGETLELTLPNRAVWIGTSNNALMTPDLASRTVIIRLDANLEDPTQRKEFNILNPPEWVVEHRRELLGAVLTLISAWLEAGTPAYNGSAMSRFNEWAQVIGGILQTVGVSGFLENYVQIEGLNPEDEDWKVFVDLWSEKYGSKPVRVEKLLPLALDGSDNPSTDDKISAMKFGHGGPLADQLGQRTNVGQRTIMGRLLHSKRDRVYNGWKIKMNKHRPPDYWLEKVGP